MRKTKIAIAVIAVLALLAAANYAFNMDPTQLAARGVGRDAHSHGDEHEDEEEAPKPEPVVPLGPEDAPVRIEVFYTRAEIYHTDFEPLIQAIYEDYKPHVRIEPRDLGTAEVRTQAMALPLHGAQGLAVNGEVIKQLPGAGAFNMVALLGSPQDRRWSPDMLRAFIEHDLKAKGVQFTPPPPPNGVEAGPQHDHEQEHSH